MGGDLSLGIMDELDELLVKAINADSSLVGVCLLLAAIAATRKIKKTIVSTDFLVNNEDLKISRAGIILTLCQPKLGGDELRKTVDFLLERWSKDDDSLQQFISVIDNNMMQSDMAWYVLERLWEKMPTEMIVERGRAIELMVGLLGQRVTRLQEDRVWKEMELPQGLHGILTGK